jgi:hypothetical protein
MGAEDIKPTTCAVEACDRPVYAKAVCHGHYYRLQSTGAPGDTPIAPGPRHLKHFEIERRECSVEGCGRKIKGAGYCDMHRKRVLKNGHPGPPAAFGKGAHFWMFRPLSSDDD